jgi:hypothetical protein
MGCRHVPDLSMFKSRPALTQPLPFAPLRSDAMRIHHLQLKGSHNSYHRAPRLSLARQWRYTHAPLEVQLSTQGVRQIELDVRYDRGQVVVGHLPIVDGRSTCRSLRRCLAILKKWSRTHPAHVPVFVFIEPKEDLAPSGLDGKMHVIEHDIRAVFTRDQLLVPDDVASDPTSLQRSVAQTGWPTLHESRGRFAFVLFGPVKHRHAYAKGRPALHGRTMFVASEPQRPESAIINLDDPLASRRMIEAAVRRGLLVRTRADARLVQDPARRNAALSSGAHFVATDFPSLARSWVDLGDIAPVRCNPISAPETCHGQDIAEIEHRMWAHLTSGR